MSVTYLDSSAIVKLVVEEPESAALRRYLSRRRPLVASALARTEVMRALLPEEELVWPEDSAVLDRLDLIRVTDRILKNAGTLLPLDMRTLDAIHIATAQELGSDLEVIASYDESVLSAARELGLRTKSPR